MIPTSVTGSSPPAAPVGNNMGGMQMNNSAPIAGNNNASNGGSSGTTNNSVLLGIASLILEGRAMAEDEYAMQTSRGGVMSSAILSANSGECGRQSPKPSTSRAAFGENFGSGAAGSTSAYSIDLANYQARKSSNSPELSSSLLRDYYSSSSESASSSVESNHSRWSQKLSQLRQESPSAQHQGLATRQRIAVECPRGSEAEFVALAISTDHHGGGLEEKRSGGDFEIIRRMSINQMNFYNSPNSMSGSGSGSGSGSSGNFVGGSSNENFMCSLQSLASNSCLRAGGSPLLATIISSPRYSTSRQLSNSPRLATPPSNQYHHHHYQQQQHQNNQSSSGQYGGMSGNQANSWFPSSPSSPQVGVGGSSGNNKEYLLRKTSTTTATQRMAIPSSNQTSANSPTTASTPMHHRNLNSSIFHKRETLQNSLNSSNTTNTSSATATPTNTSRNQTYPQQGPHCDQFLRKMGLAKGDASETEEHHCDMSYVNITCTRWRAYCIKMENILARGEPICIEVYLGPVGHKILLEQWIITQKEKQPPPTMTLPSLCSAIRSQLYFSQISAWCDLIKKSDKTIYETGRIIYPTTPQTTSAAGDLATTTATAAIANSPTSTTITTATSTTSTHHPAAVTVSNTSVSSSGSCNNGGGGSASASVGGGAVGCGKRRLSLPRLNIFYRIKQYDSTACFNSKPNVHNFPNVNITENCCISVCLKSLPRITGGIPKVGILTTQQQQQQQQQQQHQQQQNNTTQVSICGSTANVNSSKIATATDIAAGKTKVTLTDEQQTLTATATSANVTSITTKTTTTNANKPTISIMNCDNNDNLKEQHQQQQQQQQQQYDKTLTATSCSTSSPSSSSSYSINGNKTKQQPLSSSFNKDTEQKEESADLDFEYGHSFDLSAGGDGCSFAVEANAGDCDSSNSSFSTNNCGNLSHREKQLLKYRKRMMKRDKKQQQQHQQQQQQQRKTNEIFTIQTENNNQQNQMEQGEDDEVDVDNDSDNDHHHRQLRHHESANADCCVQQNIVNGQRQQLPNNHEIINSIPSTSQQQQEQQHHVKMISTGTQTISSNTCTSCGLEKSMICLKCNPLKNNNDGFVARSSGAYEEMDAESSSSSSSCSTARSLSSCDIIHTPRNKAELLLQAIQRTPKTNKKYKHKSKDSNHRIAAIKQEQQQQQQQQQLSSPSNNNGSNTNILSINGMGQLVNATTTITPSTQSNSSSSSNSSAMVGCQVCKRQKTQHHFNTSSMIEDANNSPTIPKSPLNSSSSLTNNETIVTINNSSNHVSKASTECTDDVNGDAAGNSEEDNEGDGGRMLSSDCVDNVSVVAQAANVENNDIVKVLSARSSNAVAYGNHETMEEEYFESSTKLTPRIDRCSLGGTKFYSGGAQLHQQSIGQERQDHQEQRSSCSTPPLEQEKMKNFSPNSGGISMMSQFKTPTPNEQKQSAVGQENNIQQQPKQPHKQTPKPNLLHIACNFNRYDDEQLQLQQQMSQSSNQNLVNNTNITPTTYNPLLLRRSLPKVNLTPIFCNSSSVMAVANSTSTPIPIVNGVCSNGSPSSASIKSADINITEASPTFSFESPSSPAPSLTVQKSNSAPTLPNANSNSLSPRFVKTSAIYKRRSRHLSDRSDRSSLGSDEQFSDEDVDSGMHSPFATSPVKLKTRLAAVFGRRPLLGNLEECLLQRRLVPKIEVMGFKLLLGASGGFCPTQLTIPAAAYFYELKGETLSTPYLCEIRLPRKGYTVPRYGTVQATLLNPMGMVVRMFVIPYDMRDMPSLHQTFIRQRILADSVVQSSELEAASQNISSNLDINGVNNATINTKQLPRQQDGLQAQQTMRSPQQQQRSPHCNNENQLGHFISAENMKSLRYSIHLRFQTSRSGRLMLHTDIRLLISRRTDCDTAAAHAKGVLEAPNELITNTVMPTNPKYSARQDQTSSKI